MEGTGWSVGTGAVVAGGHYIFSFFFFWNLSFSFPWLRFEDQCGSCVGVVAGGLGVERADVAGKKMAMPSFFCSVFWGCGETSHVGGWQPSHSHVCIATFFNEM